MSGKISFAKLEHLYMLITSSMQQQKSPFLARGFLRNNLSNNEQTSIRVWMLVCLCSPQTQCTGTVRIIAPSPNKGKWALGLLGKLEFVTMPL